MSKDKLILAYRNLCFRLLIENKQLLDIADNTIKRGTTTNAELKTLIAIKKSKNQKNKSWLK